MQKDDPNVYVFQNKNWCSSKSDRLLFFWLWLSKDLSIVKILSEKKYGGTWLISEKTEAFYVELNEIVEAATSSYSAPGDIIQYFYSVLVAKNQKKIRIRCSVHEFFFTDINYGYWAAILKKNCLWLLPLQSFRFLRNQPRTAILFFT